MSGFTRIIKLHVTQTSEITTLHAMPILTSASGVYFYHLGGARDYRILWGSIVMPTFFINLIEYFMILMVTERQG